MSDRESQRFALMVEFGLPPGRPNEHELETILIEIAMLDAFKASVDRDALKRIVLSHVKFSGKFSYGGQGFQDFHALLALLRVQAKAR